MAHVREGIRKAIVTAVTGLTTTSTRVFSGITYDLADKDLPALIVEVAYDPETVSEEQDEMGPDEIRALPVRITGRAKTKTTILDTLDDIAEQVETAVTGNAPLAALVVDMRLESTQVELSEGAELPVGSVTMEWVAHYLVDRTAPSA